VIIITIASYSKLNKHIGSSEFFSQDYIVYFIFSAAQISGFLIAPCMFLLKQCH